MGEERAPTDDELARVITSAADRAAGVEPAAQGAELKQSIRTTKRRVTLVLVGWAVAAVIGVAALVFVAAVALSEMAGTHIGGK